jgi:hypothetical protein
MEREPPPSAIVDLVAYQVAELRRSRTHSASPCRHRCMACSERAPVRTKWKAGAWFRPLPGSSPARYDCLHCCQREIHRQFRPADFPIFPLTPRSPATTRSDYRPASLGAGLTQLTPRTLLLTSWGRFPAVKTVPTHCLTDCATPRSVPSVEHPRSTVFAGNSRQAGSLRADLRKGWRLSCRTWPPSTFRRWG